MSCAVESYEAALSDGRFDDALELLEEAIEDAPHEAKAELAFTTAVAYGRCARDEDADWAMTWLRRCERWRSAPFDAAGEAWGARAAREVGPMLGHHAQWSETLQRLRDAPEGWTLPPGGAPSAAPANERRVLDYPDEQRVLDYVVTHGEMPLEDFDMPPEDGSEMPPEDASLAVVEDGCLDNDAFASLAAAVYAHEKAWAGDSESLGAAFRRTRGFVARFDDGEARGGSSGGDGAPYGKAAAMAKLRGHPWTQALVPFFDRVVSDGGGPHAYVLNLLVVAPDEAGVPLDEADDWAVGWHRDATIGLENAATETPPLAHRVFVLYFSKTGGDLCLRKTQRRPYRDDASRAIDRHVRPAPNRLVSFNGGAEHAVAAHRPTENSESDRISLVLEQYRVPRGLIGETVSFEIVKPEDYRRKEAV
ncbi:hypothetical protein M885DRAFT_622353 [Pelagophyceae sp. CCMP2097]|nr:hypothetical protein M885DRAFT_622353 [Pelagophyceae sp. CCMP2097]